MADTPTVHQALNGVMKSMTAVGKDRRNEHFKYQFRGIDDVLNACHGPLTEHGVFYVPEVLDADYGEAGKQRVATLKVRYRFYGPAGDYVDAVVPAEGMDTGDKAPNKAMSAALKYALIQVLCIPTEDVDDSDREAPQADEPVKPRKKAPKTPTKPEAVPEQAPFEPASETQVNTVYSLYEQFESDVQRKWDEWRVSKYDADSWLDLSSRDADAVIATMTKRLDGGDT